MKDLPVRTWAAWPVLIASAAAFSQVVSFRALVLWVTLSVLITWWVTSFLLASRKRVLAFLVGACVTLATAGSAELFAGTSDGPVTRSVFLAGGLTVAMTLLLDTPWPLLCLIPGLALLVSAISLDPSSNAILALGLAGVAIPITALMLGPYRGSNLRDGRRLAMIAGFLLVTGLFAVFVGSLLFADVSTGTAETSGTYKALADSADAVLSASTPVTTATVDAVDPPAADVAPAEAWPWWIWLAVGVGLLAFLILLIVLVTLLVGSLRRLVVAIRWRNLKRRLRRGSAADRVRGAWTWASLRQQRYDSAWPASASPDVLASRASVEGDRELQMLGTLAAKAAFDPQASMSMPDSARAWEAADLIGARPRGVPVNTRWRWAGRGPSTSRRRSG